MDIQLLGPVAVGLNGVSMVPTAPKPRQVLAMLALHADRVVPVSALFEELWREHPPRSARTTLQTYVLQIRDMISTALAAAGGPGGPATAKDVLATAQGGYVLRTGGGCSDAQEFSRLTALGSQALDEEDFPRGARLQREALALWRGSAFADVQTGPQLELESRRLEEARLCALDQRIGADLRLGRHRSLLGELTVLVSRHRTHESLHAQFMLALHRSGRRSEALKVYQRLRQELVKDLGLEPSPGLRRLHRSILMADAEHALAPSEAAPGG